MHKSTAWPLAVLYVGLVVYASWYPLLEWRDQGIAPWEFLFAPLPRYWTGFDVGINILGYMPLGALFTLGVVRTQQSSHPVFWSVLGACLLSLCMEAGQSYVPTRVPAREDWLLNTLGASLGAITTLLLERAGGIARWSRFRARWLVPQSRGGLVLMLTWPIALLFPAPVPLGLGQVWQRLEQALADGLADSAYEAWLPVREAPLLPLAPGLEVVCVALGLLIPCLLGFCIVRPRGQRAALVAGVVAVAVAVSALSAALSWGPSHTWAWLDLPTQSGMVMGGIIALLLSLSRWRVSAALALVALCVCLGLLNQAPESAYFAQTLQAWEQGRFIRFHGLAQWLGWLWPFAAMVYLLALLGRRGDET